MSPDHSGERPLAAGHDQIGWDASALGAGVRDVVDGDIAAVLDADLLQIERCFLVVVAERQCPARIKEVLRLAERRRVTVASGRILSIPLMDCRKT